MPTDLPAAARRLVAVAREYDAPDLQHAADAVEVALPRDTGRPSPVTLEQCRDAYRRHGTYAAAADELGVSANALRMRLVRASRP